MSAISNLRNKFEGGGGGGGQQGVVGGAPAGGAGGLEVRVIEARNLKKSDFIGKADPYVQLQVGPTKVRTNTHKSGGQAPRWDQAFKFDVPAGVNAMAVEVFDDDLGKDDLMGKNVNVGLMNVMSARSENTWVTVFDSSGKPAGEVHLNMTFNGPPQGGGGGGGGMMGGGPMGGGGAPAPPNMGQQGGGGFMGGGGPPQQQGGFMGGGGGGGGPPQPPTGGGGPSQGGQLDIRCIEGRNLKAKDMIGKADPYCTLQVGPTKVRTNTHKSGGTAPRWDQPFKFDVPAGVNAMAIECFDDDLGKDAVVGKNTNVPLLGVFQRGSEDTWVEIFGTNGQSAGQIHLNMTFRGAGQQGSQGGGPPRPAPPGPAPPGPRPNPPAPGPRPGPPQPQNQGGNYNQGNYNQGGSQQNQASNQQDQSNLSDPYSRGYDQGYDRGYERGYNDRLAAAGVPFNPQNSAANQAPPPPPPPGFQGVYTPPGAGNAQAAGGMPGQPRVLPPMRMGGDMGGFQPGMGGFGQPGLSGGYGQPPMGGPYGSPMGGYGGPIGGGYGGGAPGYGGGGYGGGYGRGGY